MKQSEKEEKRRIELLLDSVISKLEQSKLEKTAIIFIGAILKQFLKDDLLTIDLLFSTLSFLEELEEVSNAKK